MAAKKVDKGGYLVLRPDSGDPKEAVLMVSERLSRAAEHAVNQSGRQSLTGQEKGAH